MKKLEKKILDKVYHYETLKTTTEIILRFFSIVTVAVLLLIMLVFLLEELIEQNTLDVLQLFTENTETIITNIKDIGETLYYEIPKLPLMILAVFIIILFILVLLFLNNRKRIMNRIKSLLSYWKINN